MKSTCLFTNGICFVILKSALCQFCKLERHLSYILCWLRQFAAMRNLWYTYLSFNFHSWH